jgi:uncharacterized RDD family membrane protein YckC
VSSAGGPSDGAAYRGARLGLPSGGPGSIAGFEARAAALVVDCVAAGLVAGLFVAILGHQHGRYGALPRNWSLVPFFVDYIAGLIVAGRTLGMYLLGVRVIRVDRHGAVTPWQALIRAVLLVLIIPAVVTDKDGRGLHDRVVGTAVVRD